MYNGLPTQIANTSSTDRTVVIPAGHNFTAFTFLVSYLVCCAAYPTRVGDCASVQNNVTFIIDGQLLCNDNITAWKQFTTDYDLITIWDSNAITITGAKPSSCTRPFARRTLPIKKWVSHRHWHRLVACSGQGAVQGRGYWWWWYTILTAIEHRPHLLVRALPVACTSSPPVGKCPCVC